MFTVTLCCKTRTEINIPKVYKEIQIPVVADYSAAALDQNEQNTELNLRGFDWRAACNHSN